MPFPSENQRPPSSPGVHDQVKMARLIQVLALLFAAIRTLAGNATLRWMPLGDSITDYGCWRAWIWERFQQDGHPVDIVGGETAGENCNDLDYDRDHEGHPGYQAAEIADGNLLPGWLRANPADIVTMHLGTNDIFRGNRNTPDILASLGTLVDQMRESNPTMRIIVEPT